ncbi:MAG: hypothetical protein M3342_14930 [Bacteroidota bacterium]|nr:hypothetical protein [Bacteroidota bacterium]
MKYSAFIIPLLMATICTGQPIDTTVYSINIKVSAETNAFFTKIISGGVPAEPPLLT